MNRSILRLVAPVVASTLLALSARADQPSAPPDSPAPTRAPFTLQLGERGVPAVVVPPLVPQAGPAPMVLMLHGMCDTPENECPAFGGSATAGRFVVCPRADLACTGGGATWSARPDARARLVDDLAAGAKASLEIDASRRTLVGFSLGAFVALDAAERQKGGWKHLVLIGARVHPDAKKLKAAGVERVLLASGRHDLARDHMARVAKQLEAAGIVATYRSLGPVGHRFAPDMNAWLTEALAWLEG
ncbi:MAG: hypothetical protein IT374_08670 [Polyangiaceae bacterium]|nr:hypothetical protein [Polyangiaceae bacterium]